MQTAAALIEREEERGTERMDELLERGKANGDTLTCSELVEALEQQMMTPDAMDMLYQRLIDGNVEIVDDTEAGEMIGEEPAVAVRATGGLLDHLNRNCGCGHGAGVLEESVFRRKDVRR